MLGLKNILDSVFDFNNDHHLGHDDITMKMFVIEVVMIMELFSDKDYVAIKDNSALPGNYLFKSYFSQEKECICVTINLMHPEN